MASAVSSAAATPTGASCGTDLYQIPTTDAACALGNPVKTANNDTDVLGKCCNGAPVTKWSNDCAQYCLAVGQSVGDLTKCIMNQGAKPGDIYCNTGNRTDATATGKVSATSKPTSSASGSAAGASPTNSKGAAAGLVQPQTVSKAGLGMLAMLFVSAAAGALL